MINAPDARLASAGEGPAMTVERLTQINWKML
jgi:hypothetical protein